jgi:anti-sigma B factor antagonist
MSGSDSNISVSEPTAGVVMISPSADVDMSRSPDLRTAIQQALKSGTEKLVVHLEDVGYMDSSGLATLVEAMRLSKSSQTTLVLCAMKPKVLAIFEIARLNAFFTIVDSIDDAIAV